MNFRIPNWLSCRDCFLACDDDDDDDDDDDEIRVKERETMVVEGSQYF